MEASESFYHFDTFASDFSDPKRNPNSERVHTEFLPGNEEAVKFGDLGFYNEESIDLHQYLHLGNTPPSGHGDELLKQFGAYSSSPPVTVNVKTSSNTASTANTTHTLTQGLASVSLSAANTPTSDASDEGNIVNAAQTNATTTQLGFQVKQEPVDEHSVPEFYQPEDMPPGEDQEMTIEKGHQAQGNFAGYYIVQPSTGVVHSEDVVTSSVTGNEGHPFAAATYTIGEVPSGVNSANMGDTPTPKKRQRSVPDKDSNEYKTKRQRNNVAVRKSREKSKARNQELQTKVTSLQAENEKLNKKVELLTKELTVLRSLFTTVKPATGAGV